MKSEEEDLAEDSMDDDESLKESVGDKVTKQNFTKMFERASCGQELLPIVMNATLKLIGCHSVLRDHCEFLYTSKVKKGNQTRVPATYISLTLSNKMLLKDMVKQLSPTHAP
jgi:hypothetical protein